jgi:hypothetical protein
MLRVDQAASTDAKMSFNRRKGLKRAVTIGLSKKGDCAEALRVRMSFLIWLDSRFPGSGLRGSRLDLGSEFLPEAPCHQIGGQSRVAQVVEVEDQVELGGGRILFSIGFPEEGLLLPVDLDQGFGGLIVAEVQ